MARLVRCRLCEEKRVNCVEGTAEFREHLKVHNVWDYLPHDTQTGKYVYLGAYVGLGYFEKDKGAPGTYSTRD